MLKPMAGIGLHQNISLGQTLSPQMQQSLHFLQAPVLELRALLQQELQANPVLEESPPETPETDEPWDAEETAPQVDDDWRDYFTQNRSAGTSAEELQKRRQFFFDSQIERESLSDHLIGQLTLATEREDLLKVGEEIIGNLNDDGFLAIGLGELAESLRLSYDAVEEALYLVQSFHPPGIAARDLSEALALQLKQRGKSTDSLEFRLVTESLDQLGRRRYQELARQHRVSVDQVRMAADYIATLQPRPGSAFAPDQPHNIVQPEAAFAKNEEGRWEVVMNHDPVPRLRICDNYKDMLGEKETNAGKNDADSGGLQDYLKERIRAGRFLIKCIHQRQHTIENILNVICHHQVAFLEEGPSALKPLTMSQAAGEISVHETTVSRAVANKYVETPWGVLPIKYFFTSGYRTADGESMSNTSIKEAVAELVGREDPARPLSDTDIVAILKERGIDLARRTVAKYRSELNILPSNLRRRG